MSRMKVIVYLEHPEYRRLVAIGRELGRAPASLVREAVAEFVRRRGRPRSVQSLGAGRSGRHDLSERAEELLAGSQRGKTRASPPKLLE
jgi:hypothetical protein